MAQKVQVLLVDDLDGGEAHENVTFSLDGKAYELDLSDVNAAALREALAPFVKAARRVYRAGERPAPKKASTGPKLDTKAVRKWAAENGHNVNDRGRIPIWLEQRYRAEQGQEQ